ncbi:MAG: TetR/AcrR family transcriptional regulator [Clostridiales bacterium]|nr:TetR/AcrR family transcriptional regulator [Clostridiales bacterium]
MNALERKRLKRMKKVERTEVAILHAAKVQFEEKGIENVTVDDIAYEAGVCRMTVFNRFKTMENLMAALFNIEIDELCQYSKAANAKGIENIKLLFHRLIEDSVNYPKVTSKLISVLMLSKEAKNISKIENIIMQSIKEENDVNPLKVLDVFTVEKTTELVMGIYYGMMNHRHIKGDSFKSEEMIDEMDKAIEYLLLGGKNE